MAIGPVRLAPLALGAFLLVAGWLSIWTGLRYPGSPLVFAAFALLANALVLNGFLGRTIFFDTFIGIFFWLGFFLKLAAQLTFYRGRMGEPTGAFDGSAGDYDRALIVSSVAFVALLVASLVRRKVFSYPAAAPGCKDQALYRFYCKHRGTLLVVFVLVIVLVGASNASLVIYQRGMVTQTVLPIGLNGVYKWLLQFGLASISALTIRFEIERAGQLNRTAIFLPMLESCISNVSLLSRGMVLNVAALGLGTWRTMEALRLRIRPLQFFAAAFAFAFLFASSVLAVNYLRTKPIYEAVGGIGNVSGTVAATPAARVEAAVTSMSRPLLIDRWVGLEGVMAVSSAPNLGWDLWREAWREKYEPELSLYDRHFIESPYKGHGNKGAVHYVSLPGLVAFMFYPGSLAFLFAAMVGFALGAALLEFLCYRFCGRNLVLCALVAQVIAFRYASFGYVPAQTYLLFGAIVLNGVLIWGANWLLALPRLGAVAGSR